VIAPALCLALLEQFPAARRWVVAYSGGLDSHVLLHLCARLRAAHPGVPPVVALHVNHGVQQQADAWAAHCATVSGGLGIPFFARPAQLAPTDAARPSEAALRAARYRAFAQFCADDDLLLLAHHRDDQVETVLLRLLRGAGVAGLAGMPRERACGRARLCRPLLETGRARLRAYAEAQGLRWIEDPSNECPDYDRNYLRLEVLPALRQRWPAVAATAARVARYARDALEAEAACVAADLPRVLAGAAIELDALQALPEPRRRAVLRAWLAGLGLPPAPARSLAALLRDMTIAAADRIPETRWPGVVVRRYRGRLHVEATGVDEPNEGSWPTAGGENYVWTAGSTIALSPDVGAGLSRERLPARIDVRRRTGGEAFLPAGSTHHRPLRKWLQEHDVLPWRRENLPLLFAGDRLIAVADLGVAAEFAARAGEPSWRITWNRRGALTEADVLSSKWPAHPPIR
jgi:tRNA(Ile)-lysidine synthase